MTFWLAQTLKFLGACTLQNDMVFFRYFATAFFLTYRCSARSLLDTLCPIVSFMPWSWSITCSIWLHICWTWESLDCFLSLKNCLTLETLALWTACRWSPCFDGDWWHGWNCWKQSRSRSVVEKHQAESRNEWKVRQMTWNNLERSILAVLHWFNCSTVLSNHSRDFTSLVSVINTWLDGTNRLQNLAPPQPTKVLHTVCIVCTVQTTSTEMNSPTQSDATSHKSESKQSETQATPVASPI